MPIGIRESILFRLVRLIVLNLAREMYKVVILPLIAL